MNLLWATHRVNPAMNDALGEYIATKIWGEPRAFPLSTTLGVFEHGDLIAALVYYDYDSQAGVIQITGAAASPRWLTRPVLREMFEFPFIKLAVQAVVMRVDPDDRRLDRILTSYGFTKTRLPRLRGRHKDEMLFTLFDDVWRHNRFNTK